MAADAAEARPSASRRCCALAFSGSSAAAACRAISSDSTRWREEVKRSSGLRKDSLSSASCFHSLTSFLVSARNVREFSSAVK